MADFDSECMVGCGVVMVAGDFALRENENKWVQIKLFKTQVASSKVCDGA